MVSIHALAWGATSRLQAACNSLLVSIHAPAWGATGVPWPAYGCLRCFNPRPRMGGDPFVSSSTSCRPVSIHAPAWGATDHQGRHMVHRGVSIHAPAWGATASRDRQSPRSRVSIHAPAWGATTLADNSVHTMVFQSTPPHGGRPPQSQPPLPVHSFNPRPRMGGDLLVLISMTWLICFNPRPRMGGDLSPMLMSPKACSFNPRPRMGGDHKSKLTFLGLRVSIHAPAWGATTSCHSIKQPHGFQSTPPHGGRLLYM